MTSYIVFVLSLALARAVFVLIRNSAPVPVNLPAPIEEPPFPEHKLYEFSEELKNLNAPEHYMALFQKLSLLSDKKDLFSKVNSPLKKHRIFVDDKGIISINEQEELVNYTDDEKLTVAIAIFQLAYAIYIQTHDTYLIVQGLVPLLMQPFSHLYGNFPAKQVEAELRQLIFNHPRRVKSFSKNLTEEEIKTNSATIIQRAFRQYQFQKSNIPSEEISESLRKSMSKHHIIENPVTPKPVTFTSEMKLNWAENAKPEFKPMAKMLVQFLIPYRSHAKFMGRLQEVVHEFNKYQNSLPQDMRDYVLIVPRVSPTPKSNHWVNALALPFFIKKPLAILYPNEVTTFKNKNPSLHHLVFLDDALYSGRQLAETITSSSLPELNKIIILPFFNKSGLSILPKDCRFFLGERMIIPKEIEQYSNSFQENCWTEATSVQLDKTLTKGWWRASEKVGCFFNHKVGDDASTFIAHQPFTSLEGLSVLHSKKDPLIPYINPPYR